MQNSANALTHDSRGKFIKGNVANPFGPNGKPAMHVRGLARAWTDRAIKRLGEALSGPDSTAIRAAEILLERAWGKPAQPVDMTVITLEDLDQLIHEIGERLAQQAMDQQQTIEHQPTDETVSEPDEASSMTSSASSAE